MERLRVAEQVALRSILRSGGKTMGKKRAHPIAVWGVSNSCSLNVYRKEDTVYGGERMLIGLNDSDPGWHSVQYNEDGEPYIIFGKAHWYLKDCMLVGNILNY